MAEAHTIQFCDVCLEERLDSGPMFRDHKAEGKGGFARPWGYSLRAGDRGYFDFGRMAENGHVPEPDEHSHLGAGAISDEELERRQWEELKDPRTGRVLPTPEDSQMRELIAAARADFPNLGPA